MTLHVLPNLKPEDKWQYSDETHKTLIEAVFYNLNTTIAYAIQNYSDWLVYTCVRYIEEGGIDDLSEIEKFVAFDYPVESWSDLFDKDKLRRKIIDDIYVIVRTIYIQEKERLKNYVVPTEEQRFNISKAIDEMMNLMSDETKKQWCDVMTKCFETLSKAPKTESVFTDKLMKVTLGMMLGEKE